MSFKLSIAALALAGLSNAVSTVTVSINTGVCPAIYSQSSTGLMETSSTSSSSSASSDSTSSSLTSSSTSSSSTSSSAPFPSGYDRSPCPCPIGTETTDAQDVNYEVVCESGIIGDNLATVNATSFYECMTMCDLYGAQAGGDSCVAITFIPTEVEAGNCMLKSAINNILLYDYGGDSAKLSSYNFAPEVSSSIASVAATHTSSVAVVTTSTTSTSTAPTGSPTYTACPCPEQDGQTIYDSFPLDFDLHCNATFPVFDTTEEGGAKYSATFDDCMLHCDEFYSDKGDCTGLTYTGDDTGGGENCYLSFTSDPTYFAADSQSKCVALVPVSKKRSISENQYFR